MRIWHLARPAGLAHADAAVTPLESHALLQHAADDALSLSLYRARRESRDPIGCLAHLLAPRCPESPEERVYLTVRLRDAGRRSPAKTLRIMQQVTDVVAAALHEFQPRLLGDYFLEGHHYNEVLEFLSFLARGVWQPVCVSRPAPIRAAAVSECESRETVD